MMKWYMAAMILLLGGSVSAQQWKAHNEAEITQEKNEVSVVCDRKFQGIKTGITRPKPGLMDVSFEAKGDVPLSCAIFGPAGVSLDSVGQLSDDWKPYSVRHYFSTRHETIQFYGRKKGNFALRNFQLAPVKLPDFPDLEIAPYELELAKGKNGKIVRVDGRTARKGKRWYRLMTIDAPQTAKPLYVYLEVKTNEKGKPGVTLMRNSQPIVKTLCAPGDQWQWVRLGPVSAEAVYPACDVYVNGDTDTELLLARGVVATDPEWVPAQGAAKADSAPGLVIGRGSSGVVAGPFIRVNENRFAAEQTTLKMNWDDQSLKAVFHCRETVLDPMANRLHEFTVNNKKVFRNDCVILLLKRNGVLYDFVVTGGGRLEDASAKGKDLWAARDPKWNSGAKASAATGDGFWTASLEIPWQSIGGKPAAEERITFQAGRYSSPEKEHSVLFSTNGGYHTVNDFGTLKFTDSVPEIQSALPQFVPGRNSIRISGAAASGKILFPGFPVRYFHGSDFELTRSGKFHFSWRAVDPKTKRAYFISPEYDLATTAVPIRFDAGNEVTLNGRKAQSGALLADGLNPVEVKMPFRGEITANGSKITPPAARFTLAVNTSVLWPNWQAKELAVNRGALQMLLFSPGGFPGMTVKDYTIKLNLPKGFKLECASGYYDNYRLEYTPDGEIRVLTEIPYRKNLPLHKYIAAFVRVPANFRGDTTELTFAAGSKSQNVIEVPQKVAVRLLPARKGVRPKNLWISICSGWLKSLTDKKYQQTVMADLKTAGINLSSSTIASPHMPHGYSFTFQSWSWSLAPYVKLHPEAALTLKNGKKDLTLVCPQHIRKPEFSAWVKAQMPTWLKKARNPVRVEWDYEYNISNGPLSCYCEQCSEETDPASRDRAMADTARIFRDAVKAHSPGTKFFVYSGYQSEETKSRYGVDWSMLKDIVDVAACGYGRPVRDLEATRQVLGKTPLMLGAIVVPYKVESRAYPKQFTPAWLLRRAVDSTAGILLYELSSFDGNSLSACAEVSRIMAKYEDFIRFGVRKSHAVPGWAPEEVQAIEYQGKSVLFLMNGGKAPKTYQDKSVAPGGVLVQSL